MRESKNKDDFLVCFFSLIVCGNIFFFTFWSFIIWLSTTVLCLINQSISSLFFVFLRFYTQHTHRLRLCPSHWGSFLPSFPHKAGVRCTNTLLHLQPAMQRRSGSSSSSRHLSKSVLGGAGRGGERRGGQLSWRVAPQTRLNGEACWERRPTAAPPHGLTWGMSRLLTCWVLVCFQVTMMLLFLLYNNVHSWWWNFPKSLRWFSFFVKKTS